MADDSKVRSMKALPKITSDFAIVDVKSGRKKLANHFKDRPNLGPCPKSMRIPVLVAGYIDGVHGADDGESQEFSVTVESVILLNEAGE